MTNEEKRSLSEWNKEVKTFDSLCMTHREHGCVSILNNKETGIIEIKHNGALVTSIENQTKSLETLVVYLHKVTTGEIIGKRLYNIAS